MNRLLLSLFLFLFIIKGISQTLTLPPRPTNAPTGSEFINIVWSMTREQREEEIYSQILGGNIPNFMRQLVAVNVELNIGGNVHTAVYYVIPEYLAVGTDSDYFLTPMTPILAQRICNAIKCTMPTKKMVDQIYSSAPCKLRPQPIPPTPQMTTVPVFAQHNDSVKSIRLPLISQYPLGTLVGGTKKDVIISNRIYQNLNPNVPKPVVIYGWHQLNGQPIQPVYNGHEETYADYSHGIRLVLDSVIVDGTAKTFTQLLADPIMNVLVSDEGTISKPYYTIAGNVTPVPKTFAVISNSSTSIKVSVTPITGTVYKAFYGNDGIFFNDSTAEFTDNIIVSNLQTDSIFFFKLRALSSSGYSIFSEVLAAVPSNTFPQVLIVNGFDRATSGNTLDFIRQHGKAFRNNGYSFSSSTNEAVTQGIVSLQDYLIVDYILGEESTVDETFNNSEQNLVKNFLRNGGKLFVSGAEIAWDLDYKGSTSDKEFIYNYLKCQYVNDAPNGQAGVYYQAESVQGNIFDRIGTINFDNGSQGTYNVRYPDVISGINGGINFLKYSNVTNQNAGVYFEGNFTGGTFPGKVICIGFPFETIYPESKRNSFMEKVIAFFNRPINAEEPHLQLVNEYRLYQNYPNPFNPNTTFAFSIPENVFVSLKIYDVLGNEITTLINEEKSAGYHSFEFNGETLTSGIYYYKLTAGLFSETKKMILIK